MKTVITLALTLIGMTFISLALKGKATSNAEYIQLDVVIASESCNIPSAVYQVMEDGYSKVTDLESINDLNTKELHTKNARKVYEVFRTMGLDMKSIEVIEHDQNDSCSRTYSFIHLNK